MGIRRQAALRLLEIVDKGIYPDLTRKNKQV